MAPPAQLSGRRWGIAAALGVAVLAIAMFATQCGGPGRWSLPSRAADVGESIVVKWTSAESCAADCPAVEGLVGVATFEVLDEQVDLAPNDEIVVAVTDRTGWYACGPNDAGEERSQKDALVALRWNARQTVSAGRYRIWIAEPDPEVPASELPIAQALFEGSCG